MSKAGPVLGIAAGALGAQWLVLPSLAEASCTGQTSGHCYALTDWFDPGQIQGSDVYILTSSLALSHPTTDRIQNETWTVFNSGYWVEVGDTSGYIPSGSTTDLHYFYAADNASGFTEVDYKNGPAVGSYFLVGTAAEGGGGWCYDIGAVQQACTGGFTTYADELQAGLEFAGTPPVTNNGTAIGVAVLKDGRGHTWQDPANPANHAQLYKSPNAAADGYCVRPTSYGYGSLAFGTSC